MPNHTDNTILDKNVFDDQNFERKSLFCSAKTCSMSLFVFLSNFVSTFDYVRLLLAFTLGQKLWRIHSLCRNLVQRSRLHFTFAKVMNKQDKKTAFLYLWLHRAFLAKRTWYMSGWKLEHFNPNLTKFVFFYQHPQPLYDVMQKRLIILSLFNVYTLNLSTL